MFDLLEHEALYGAAKKDGGRRGSVVDPKKDGRTKQGRTKKDEPDKGKKDKEPTDGK